MSGGLPFCTVRVVRASRLLEAVDKLLWGELHTFDTASRRKGEAGAYIGARALAERLGATEHAIEHGRRRLIALGLLATNGGRGRRGARYYPLLPASAVPTSEKPSPEMMTRCAAVLDAHIASARNGATTCAIPGGTMAQQSSAKSAFFPFPLADDEPVSPGPRIRRVGGRSIGDVLRDELPYFTADDLPGMAQQPRPTTPNNGARNDENGADGASTIEEVRKKQGGGEVGVSASAPSSPSCDSTASTLSPPSSAEDGAGTDCARAHDEAGANDKTAAQERQRAADIALRANYQAHLATASNAAERKLLEHGIRQIERRLAPPEAA